MACLTVPASAVDYSCQRQPDTYGKDPLWTTSGNKDLKFVVSWAFRDPENCIVGMHDSSEVTSSGYFRWKAATNPRKDFQFPAKWTVSRDGEMALVSAETEFPVALLLSLPNRNLDGLSFDLQQVSQEFEVFAGVKVKENGKFGYSLIYGRYGLSQLWGNWFSKNQGLHASECKPISPDSRGNVISKYKLDYKVIESGPKPVVEILIEEPSNCIFLVHSGPLAQVKRLASSGSGGFLAEHPFWSGEAPTYFDSILKSPNQLVQIGTGNFIGSRYLPSVGYRDENILGVDSLPTQTLSHFDTVRREGNKVIVTTTIDGSQINPKDNGNLTIYTGFYSWYSKESSYLSGGWRVSFSGNTWSARYSSGSSLPGGLFMSYTTDAVKIPISKLLSSSEALATEATNAKGEADAKPTSGTNTKSRVTIKCAKGSTVKKVTAVNPKCPPGFRQQKVRN
jgi:hypothetical protein